MRGRKKSGNVAKSVQKAKADLNKILAMNEGKLRKLPAATLEQALSAYLQQIERELTSPNTLDAAELKRCAERTVIINKFIKIIAETKQPENNLAQEIIKIKDMLGARVNEVPKDVYDAAMGPKAPAAATAKPLGMKALFKNAPKQAKAQPENLQMMAEQAEAANQDITAQLQQALADEAKLDLELKNALAEDKAREAAEDEQLRAAFEEHGIEPESDDGASLEGSGVRSSEGDDNEEDELDESSTIAADDEFVRLLRKMTEIDDKIYMYRLEADRYPQLVIEDRDNRGAHIKSYAAAVKNCEALIPVAINLRQRIFKLIPDVEGLDKKQKEEFISQHSEDMRNYGKTLTHYQNELASLQPKAATQSPPAARAMQPDEQAVPPKAVDETQEILNEIGRDFAEDNKTKLNDHLAKLNQLLSDIQAIKRAGKYDESLDLILAKTAEAISLFDEIKLLEPKVGPEFAGRIEQAGSQLQVIFALNTQMNQERELAKAPKQPVVGKSAAEVLKQASKEKSAGLEPQPLAAKIVEPKIVEVEAPISEIKPEEIRALIEEANQILKIGITHISLETRLPDHELEEIRGRINNPIHARIKSAVERYAIDSNPAIKTLYDQYFENFRNKRNIVRIHDGIPPSPTVGRVTEPNKPAAPAKEAVPGVAVPPKNAAPLDPVKDVAAAPVKAAKAGPAKETEKGKEEANNTGTPPAPVDVNFRDYMGEASRLRTDIAAMKQALTNPKSINMGDIERAARSQQQRANELKKLVNLRVSEISAEELLAAQRLFEEVLTGYAEIIQKIERIETVRESIVRFRDDLNIDDEVINVSARALTNIDTLPQHELVRIRDELVNSQAFLRSSNVVNFVSRTIEYLETTRDPEAREQCDRHADLNRRASESLNQIETRLRSFGPPPPPPPPPAAPAAKRIMAKAVANPPHYFFAYTLEEFINKGTELQATNNNNLKDYELAAERALTASKALNISASTQQQRISIQHNIDTQLNKLRDLIGFLEDCERRAKGVNRDRAGRPREDDLINAPMKMSKEVIAERLLRLHECEATLLEAKAKIQPILASGATKNVYYTNLDYHNVCATEAEALQKATEYLRNNGSAGINENHTVAAGHRNIGDNTTELYSYRFTPTEITTSTGTLPVALIQQTNQSQTYSKQTVLTPKGTLEALKKMTHDEQVEFVRDMIETQLASITTNGPIRLSRNWDPALAKAAALHCKAMGYDLQPSEWLKKVKDKDATNYFTSNVNQPFMQQAIARRDMKLHAKSAPRSAARTPSSPAPLPVSPKLPPVAPLKAAGAKAPLAAKDPKVAEPDPIRPPHPGRGHHK